MENVTQKEDFLYSFFNLTGFSIYFFILRHVFKAETLIDQWSPITFVSRLGRCPGKL